MKLTLGERSCAALAASYLALSTMKATPMQTADFRFPGVLNSKELLVAEAVQARAWAVLAGKGRFRDDDQITKAKLGGIVVRLMAGGPQSIGDLASAAIDSFERGTL